MNWDTMTTTELLDELATLDAARWGEAEREPSRRLHAGKTRGLLLNTLLTRLEHGFGDAAPEGLRAATEAALTSADRAVLRTGG